MKKIHFAIVGCGRIGARHAQHIQNKGRLVAVCDIDRSKADALASQYQALAYYSLDELLSSATPIQVVAVCTPNGLHAQHSIQSLKAGYHVICEKPMALSVRDCREMINTAELTQRHLFIVKQNRFNPPVVKVKTLLDEGVLGKVLSLQLSCFWNRNAEYYQNSWKGTHDLDGGTLFTQFSHFVDLLYWMVGDVHAVQAYFQNYLHQGIIDFEDTGTVILRFTNGAIGTLNYTVNCYRKNMEGSLTLFCEKGTVKIGGQYLNQLEYQQIEGYEIRDLPPGNPANEYGHYQGSMSNHDKVYDNVIEVLQNRGTIATSGYEGLKTVEIIEKIYATGHQHAQ